MYNYLIMNIISFEKLDSTNTYCKLNLDKLADKTVVSTSLQIAGRGRFERSWIDLGCENIYMSIVLKLSENFSETYSNLTQYMSVILCVQLEEMGLKPQIKWPNDVLLNDKKVCGILAEAVFKGQKLNGIVLGIGVNLNAKIEQVSQIDRPATSVNLELGREVDKAEFMQKLLDKFFLDYDEFLGNGFISIKDDYVKRASFLNQDLNIGIFNKVQSGFANGVDDKGALVLVDSEGKEHIINMGEII